MRLITQFTPGRLQQYAFPRARHLSYIMRELRKEDNTMTFTNRARITRASGMAMLAGAIALAASERLVGAGRHRRQHRP